MICIIKNEMIYFMFLLAMNVSTALQLLLMTHPCCVDGKPILLLHVKLTKVILPPPASLLNFVIVIDSGAS